MQHSVPYTHPFAWDVRSGMTETKRTPPSVRTRLPSTVVVTGASGALGSVVAGRLHDAGVTLVLPTRGDPAGLTTQFPGAQGVTADITTEAGADAVAATAQEAGGADAALLLAGGFGMGDLASLTPAALNTMMTANVLSALLPLRALAPQLKASQGAALGISASAARGTKAKMGAYGASKAALEAVLSAAQAELKADGVHVGWITPEGTLDTPANRTAMPDADRSAWVGLDGLTDAIVHWLGQDRRAAASHLHVAALPDTGGR